MGMAVRREGDAIVLAVSGDLDLENIAPLAAALTEAGGTTGGAVILDLSGVTFADSTTVNVLLQAHFALGPRLRVAEPSAFVRRLFGIVGLEQALTVHDTAEDALAATRPSTPLAPDGGQ